MNKKLISILFLSGMLNAYESYPSRQSNGQQNVTVTVPLLDSYQRPPTSAPINIAQPQSQSTRNYYSTQNAYTPYTSYSATTPYVQPSAPPAELVNSSAYQGAGETPSSDDNSNKTKKSSSNVELSNKNTPQNNSNQNEKVCLIQLAGEVDAHCAKTRQNQTKYIVLASGLAATGIYNAVVNGPDYTNMALAVGCGGSALWTLWDRILNAKRSIEIVTKIKAWSQTGWGNQTETTVDLEK